MFLLVETFILSLIKPCLFVNLVLPRLLSNFFFLLPDLAAETVERGSGLLGVVDEFDGVSDRQRGPHNDNACVSLDEALCDLFVLVDV